MVQLSGLGRNSERTAASASLSVTMCKTARRLPGSYGASFRRLCGFAMSEPTPARTAFVRFRKELVARDLDARLFDGVLAPRATPRLKFPPEPRAAGADPHRACAWPRLSANSRRSHPEAVPALPWQASLRLKARSPCHLTTMSRLLS